MNILLCLFVVGFSWFPIERGRGDTYDFIESSTQIMSIVERYGGKKSLGRTIRLDDGVFHGGCKVLLPKDIEIGETPDNMKFLKRTIELETGDRYSALYDEDGNLTFDWKNLKRRFAERLGVRSPENIPCDEIKRLLPEEKDVVPDASSRGEGDYSGDIDEGDKYLESKYPRKMYLSFLTVEKDRREKLYPVMLVLDPLNGLKTRCSQSRGEGGAK